MIRFVIPGKSRSAPNLREHPMERHRRVKAARRKALERCPKWAGGPLLVVSLWRFGMRTLDGDNLAGALKAYRDGIASRLGVDDGSPLVAWRYHQGTCPSGQERIEVVISRPSAADDQLSRAEKHLEEAGAALVKGLAKQMSRDWKALATPNYRRKT